MTFYGSNLSRPLIFRDVGVDLGDTSTEAALKDLVKDICSLSNEEALKIITE